MDSYMRTPTRPYPQRFPGEPTYSNKNGSTTQEKRENRTIESTRTILDVKALNSSFDSPRRMRTDKTNPSKPTAVVRIGEEDESYTSKYVPDASLQSILSPDSSPLSTPDHSGRLPLLGPRGWGSLHKQPVENAIVNDRRKAQLTAYVSWVNSQLKKKPGAQRVQDLRTDMQDGVALANLIEIVAGEVLEGVYPTPTTVDERCDNVNKVLHFMTSRRIRMHPTTAEDIVKGNLKSIMRLILSLAAHYKPNSVKQSAHAQFHDSKPPPSMAAIAQGAAAALAEARRDAASVGQRPRRPRQLGSEHRFHGSGSDSDHGFGDRNRYRSGDRGELEGASSGSSPTPSSRTSPHSSHPGSPRIHRKLDFGVEASVPKSRSQDFVPGHASPNRCGASQSERGLSLSEEDWVELLDDHDHLSVEMVGTKKALLKLQDLLLSGQPPDGEEAPAEILPFEGDTPQEQLVVMKSKLQQSEEVCKELREELSKVKDDRMQLQGTKAGLQQRLADQEDSFLIMKAELLRVGFVQQSLENDKVDLEKQVKEKDKLMLELRRELAHRDRQVEDLVNQMQIQQREKEAATRSLRAQIIDLHEKLKRVGETEASLSARVASQDRKMARLEGKILQNQYDGSRPSSARSGHSAGSDDMLTVRESLRTLRTSFPGNDPQHHTIDALESSISSLMERLHASEQMDISGQSKSRLSFDSTGDIRRSPITALHGFPAHRLDSPVDAPTTKVLYFTDRTVTPFMCTIPKKLGEITLRDFKCMFDRQGLGNKRYHFKAMDPEFGTVKEEISHDDDILPGWEGKIVAWIEEDHG